MLVGGALIFYVERGGRTLLSFTEDPTTAGACSSGTRKISTPGSARKADSGAGRRRARLRLDSCE